MDIKNKESNFVSAVIYIHNAENVISSFLKQINSILAERFKHFEIICVDDKSQDNSRSIINEMGKVLTDTQLSVVTMSYYQGIEAAMKAGVDFAIGDYVFEFDSCFMDYVPELVMQVYSRALQGYDIVSASPEYSRRRSSRLFYRVFNHYSHTMYSLQTEQFRILSRRLINRIHDRNSKILYRKMAYANSGLKSDVLRYTALLAETISKDPEQEKIRRGVAIDTLVSYTDIAYRFSVVMSLLLSAFALLTGIYALVVFLTAGAVEGWTTTMLFLSIAFFGVFAILTLITKYLSIIVRLVVDRKDYNVEKIEKMAK